MTPVAYLASLVLLLMISTAIAFFGVVELWIALTGQSEKYHTNSAESTSTRFEGVPDDAFEVRFYNGARGAMLFAWGATTVAYTVNVVSPTAFAVPVAVTVLLYGGVVVGDVVGAEPA